MIRYRAIQYFTDLQANKHEYNKGDEYPRDGLTVTEKRINELLGSDNKQKRPVIEIYTEEVPFEPKKYTTKQLESMTIAQIENLAEELGYEITKTLKADIIEEFMDQQ